MTPPWLRFFGPWLLVFVVVGLVAGSGSAQLLPGIGDEEEEAADEVEEEAIAPLAEVDDDADLADRLNVIYDNIGDLEDVEAEVGEGVVRLTGTVVSSAAREQARDIAARQEGIVAVDNRITIARDLGRRLAPVRQKVGERLFDILASLPLLLISLAVVALFWVGARWIGQRERLYARVSDNRFVRDLAAQVLSTVLFVLGVLLALEVLDATALVGAVLGTAGVIGLAVGFAFRDLAENYIASVLLSIRQPFAAGDHVIVGDREGKVVRLTSRATILVTLDGNHLRIPNAEVFKGTLLNYSTNPRRRFQFLVGVGNGEDLNRVRDVALETLHAVEGVLADPEPMVLIEELGDSTVDLRFFGWIDQREVSFGKVRSEALRRVKERFDAEGISMPEPAYRVQMLEPTPEAAVTPTREHPRSDPTRAPADIAPETHLDDEIAEERAREEDLLSADARSE